MITTRLLILSTLLAAGPWTLTAGEATPKVASGPTVERDGDTLKIGFAVSAPTDVEVAILDGKGTVVRHLAAGMLGPNAPVPLKKDSLTQELSWDGKDDNGAPALRRLGERGQVRIRLGMRARFERLLGWSGQSIDATRGLVCGPDGKLYVTSGLNDVSIHRETTIITAHKRDGTYSHQVFPGPANLPPEKRKGWPPS